MPTTATNTGPASASAAEYPPHPRERERAFTRAVTAVVGLSIVVVLGLVLGFGHIATAAGF